VANDVTRKDAGFAVDTNQVTILRRQGEPERLPLLSKEEVAELILDRLAELLTARGREGRVGA
jgi:phosphopantothenoylcysteine decarboxylase/phosphopantothenate--cysteine ligase